MSTMIGICIVIAMLMVIGILSAIKSVKDESYLSLADENLTPNDFSRISEEIRRRDLSKGVYDCAEKISKYLGTNGYYGDVHLVITKKPVFLMGFGHLEVRLFRADGAITVYRANKLDPKSYPEVEIFREGLWIKYLTSCLHDAALKAEASYVETAKDGFAPINDFSEFADILYTNDEKSASDGESGAPTKA